MNGMPCLSRISEQEAKASGDGAPGFQFKQTATGSCRRCGEVADAEQRSAETVTFQPPCAPVRTVYPVFRCNFRQMR